MRLLALLLLLCFRELLGAQMPQGVGVAKEIPGVFVSSSNAQGGLGGFRLLSALEFLRT